MAQLIRQANLEKYHTFGIPHQAKALFEFENTAELTGFLESEAQEFNHLLPIGSGSNLLFTKTFDGCLLHNCDKSIEILSSDKEKTLVKTGGGLEWDDFIAWSVQKKLYGMENLSLIPGTTGATPVQNIGAYGVEVKDFIVEVEAIELGTCQTYTFSNEACRFGYRDSIFKNEWRNRFLVTSVTYALYNEPRYNVDYGKVKEEVERLGTLDQSTLRQAIINIRNSKLPDPDEIGNAGSFFKNPIVSDEKANKLIREFPGIPHFKTENHGIKLAAGWLIDQCGLKGYKTPRGAGIHDKQALVLVNHGVESGADILELAHFVQKKVKTRFGVSLEPEATIL